MVKPQIIIVDENDKIIGFKDRQKLDKEDIYRVSALWITNSFGQILMAKRHHNKVHHPGKWGPGVAGTVEKGETYRTNIIKEAEEELGLKNIEPKVEIKIKVDDDYHYFGQWYSLKIDKNINDFKIQEDEVEEIKWFGLEELEENFKNSPEKFLPNMAKYLKLFS